MFSTASGTGFSRIRQRVAIRPEEVYEASVYGGAAYCSYGMGLVWYDSTGGYISWAQTVADEVTVSGTATSGNPLDIFDRPRLFRYGTAPANAAYADVLLEKEQGTSTSTSFVVWHMAQLTKWGGGTSAGEARPWVPPTGAEVAAINTGNLGTAAATEIYTAASSGTGHARFDYVTGTHNYYTWDQSCSVAVPVENGDTLGVYVVFSGDAGNLSALYDYTRAGYDVVISGGTGTAWHTDSADKTNNFSYRQAGAGSNTTLRELTITGLYTSTAAGTATVHGGAGCAGTTSTGYTDSGQTFLRVERIKR
jgi:hypothetical protein